VDGEKPVLNGTYFPERRFGERSFAASESCPFSEKWRVIQPERAPAPLRFRIAACLEALRGREHNPTT
jgi:hypothetical protein